MYPVLRQVLELEPLRARLAACWAEVDARALARAGLAFARHQAVRA